jgi:hypothetical protein
MKALLALALIAACDTDVRGSFEARKAFLDDRRALFDDPSDLQIEGSDGQGLVMLDRACTPQRIRRYAVDRAVREAGFRYVRCRGGARVDVE